MGLGGDLTAGGERVLESVEEEGDGARFVLPSVFCIFLGGGRSDDEEDELEDSLDLSTVNIKAD